MTKHFTHLHVHTEFSLLDGAIRLSDLVQTAKEQEWKAVGISDHGNIFGAVKFFQLARRENIKPVLGVEMYFTPDIAIKNPQEKYFHLILIVQNWEGYKNLCRLMKIAYQDGYYFKPRIDYATLKKYSNGLIATTGCVGGDIPTQLRMGNLDLARKRTQWFQDVFGPDRFFFELQPAEFDKQLELNPLLLNYAHDWGVKCIATSDAHYLHLADNQAHEVMLSVQTKGQLSDPDRYSFGDCKAYLRTLDQMKAAFPHNEELLWNTGMIADQCEFDFEFGKLFFPQFPIPEKHTQETYFEHLCRHGLQTLKNDGLVPEDQYDTYDARLKEEVDLITSMGFIGYFLVVSDFIKWALTQNIPVGPGRGSAAGSLVAWALQITNIDPIKYNLLFERFLNPERVTMPDIDIDFCINRREDVINYVKDKYGHDCVCQIITFGTMMAKGVLKDVSRVLGIPFQDANAITDMIPNQLKISLQEALDQEPRLQEMIDNNPRVKQLFDISFKLEGLTRHASKHAAGVVISPEKLEDCMPLYIPSKSDELVSQYAMTELEAIGFLKMDFLGLKNLTVIQQSIQAIKKNHGVDIDLNRLPRDDEKAFQLLKKGHTKGIFQFESDGIGEVLRKLQPEKFEDLIAVNALYRPGPLGSGMVDDYIERKHGRKKTTYMFPELEPILSETYGVIVYQEQVMKIASAIAGYTLGSADILRRAMGKKKADVMAQQKEMFVTGATQKGFDSKKSGELFDLMAFFAGYGFNKSHSAAYALIAYQTAYLKAHYPHEFMAALVSFETSNPDQMTKYLQEIHDMQIEAITPDINRSEIDFVAVKSSILFGLQGIKNVGGAALQNIIEVRKAKPFLDMLDFACRVDLRTVNKRVMESLICAGAFDTLPGNRAQQTAELEKIIDQAHSIKKERETGQTNLFGAIKDTSTSDLPDVYVFAPLDDWPDKDKLEKEKEVIGFYLSSHPLKSFKAVEWVDALPFTDALELTKNVTSIKEPFVTCCGLALSQRQITTKKGDRMAFMKCEDFSGNAEIIIFPKLFAKVSDLLDQHQVFIIKGVLDITSQNMCKIKANELIPIETLFDNPKTIRSAKLELAPGQTEQSLADLKEKLPKGPTPLRIGYQENNLRLELLSSQKISCTQEKLSALKELGISVILEV